jgi:hypothetical protein
VAGHSLVQGVVRVGGAHQRLDAAGGQAGRQAGRRVGSTAGQQGSRASKAEAGEC